MPAPKPALRKPSDPMLQPGLSPKLPDRICLSAQDLQQL